MSDRAIKWIFGSALGTLACLSFIKVSLEEGWLMGGIVGCVIVCAFCLFYAVERI